MKIAILTDQHFGVRNDNVAFYDYQAKFYREVVLPYIDANDIKVVWDGGDTFDRRKYINFHSLKAAKDMWFDELRARDVQLYTIVGNHTAYYKNTNEVNTMELLFADYENMHIVSEAKTLNFDGLDVAFLPWICSGNYQSSMDFINDTPAQVLIGHLELAGFEMYKGVVGNDHGFDSKLFDKFDVVMSGHFHHKSTKGNINYLGAPYEMTWSDYNDPRGFHIFDTDSRELTFIQNPFPMFHKVLYDDVNKSMDEVIEQDFSSFGNSFVKLIVRNKTNPYWFDIVVDKIEKTGVLDLQIVEDHLNLDLEDDSDIVDEAEDTLTIMRKFVAQYLPETEQTMAKDLNNLLTELYQEALSAEHEA